MTDDGRQTTAEVISRVTCNLQLNVIKLSAE